MSYACKFYGQRSVAHIYLSARHGSEQHTRAADILDTLRFLFKALNFKRGRLSFALRIMKTLRPNRRKESQQTEHK